MPGRGFIHDKLEIKFLILYIVSRVIEPIPFDVVLDLTMCDDAIDYFDFSDCLADLVLLECLQDAGDGRVSGFDDGIGAGKAAEITIAPIFSFQDQTAGQGSLHEDDGVEGIDMDGATGVKRVQLFCMACV